MGKIREYTSKLDKLTLDEKAYQAWEMAGRRVGPLYNQAGTEYGKVAKDIEEAAKLAGTDISEYEKQLVAHREARSDGGAGGSSRPPKATGPGAAARITDTAADLVRQDYGPALGSDAHPAGKFADIPKQQYNADGSPAPFWRGFDNTGGNGYDPSLGPPPEKPIPGYFSPDPDNPGHMLPQAGPQWVDPNADADAAGFWSTAGNTIGGALSSAYRWLTGPSAQAAPDPSTYAPGSVENPLPTDYFKPAAPPPTD